SRVSSTFETKIEALEREILSLRRKARFDGVEIPRNKQQPRQVTTPLSGSVESSVRDVESTSDTSTSTNHSVPSTSNKSSNQPSTNQPTDSTSNESSNQSSTALTTSRQSSTTSSQSSTTSTTSKDIETSNPVHPYASVSEATYRPPQDRNFASKPAPSKE